VNLKQSLHKPIIIIVTFSYALQYIRAQIILVGQSEKFRCLFALSKSTNKLLLLLFWTHVTL